MNPAGPRLRLGAGDIHVWWIDLTRMPESDAVLSADERARAARFRQAQDRHWWIAAHVALRQVLSRYIEMPPDALRLETGAQGKPALLDEPSLCFNLAHAGERAALAVAWQREVGIDLEPFSGDLPVHQDLKALLAAACTPAEAAWIASLPLADRRAAFLRRWTLKEAYLKGIGVGLSVEPRMVEVSPHPQPLRNPSSPTLLPSERGEGSADVAMSRQRQRHSTSTAPSPGPTGGVPTKWVAVGGEGSQGEAPSLRQRHWTLCLLNPGPAWVAALACAGSPPSITEFHWPLIPEPSRTGAMSV